MRRGTRVGQAYVAVTADGSGINDSIADAFDDVDFKEIGDKHGDAYAKRLRAHLGGFNKDFDQIVDRMGNNLSSRLSKAIETDSALSQSVSQTLARAFDSGKLNELIEYAGRRAGHTFGTEFDATVRREVLDALESAMERAVRSGSLDLSDLVRGVNAGGGQIELLGSIADDAVRRVAAARTKMDKEIERSVAEQARAIEMGEKANAAIAKAFAERRIQMHQVSNMKIEHSDETLVKSQQRLFEQLRRTHEAEAARAEAAWQRLGVMQEKAFALNERFNAGLLDGRGRGVSGNGSSLDDMIGSLFGKGSRNNALNLLGSTMKSVVGLVMEGQKFASGFAQGIGQAADNASILQKAFSGLQGGAAASSIGKGLTSIAKSGPAAVIALIAVIGVMSTMISVAGALLAILTAMASTVATALVGAFLVLAPAMTAAVAGASLLTAAFMSMTDAQKSLLSDAFRPLHQELIGIGQLMLQDMVPAFGTWSANLQQALLLVVPLAQRLGSTFAEAGNMLTASLAGPGFQLLATSLGTYLPGIILRLTAAFGSFLNGVAGTFAALMPLVTRFSTYLAQVADRFSAWANSTQGQNAIVDFADRAMASLRSLWNFVREFSGLVFDLLFDPNAQAAGNTIFDGLARTFGRFREKLAQASADGSLRKWFDDAIRFGSRLWAVIESLARLFMEFYNAGTLDAVGDLLGTMASAMDLAAKYADPLIDAVGGLAQVMSVVLVPIAQVSTALDRLTEKAGGALNVLKAVPVVGGWIGGLAGLTGGGGGSSSGGSRNPLDSLLGSYGNGLGVLAPGKNPLYPTPPKMPEFKMPDLNELISMGNTALNNTSQSAGGYKPPKEKPKWKNPYVEYANSLIQQGPTMMAQVKAAFTKINRTFTQALRESYNTLTSTLRDVNTDAAKTIRDLAKSTDSSSVTAALQSMVETFATNAANTSQQMVETAQQTAAGMRSAADSAVASAQSNLNSAAARLANASTPKEARQALAEVQAAKRALATAKKARDDAYAEATRLVVSAQQDGQILENRIQAANQILATQSVLNPGVAERLVLGMHIEGATMADYAAAREMMAAKIEDANQKLLAAISLRDEYAEAIANSVRTFGALTTAQAQTINGVQQALTATDITSNLQARLDKVRKFQDNLRILLAMGLSNDAYKQILDAGVEQGGAFAEALIQGGQGAVSQTNNLTSQINDVAESLGLESSNRLYQAGVDAAQGLVDGLMSLSEELDTAATRLGETIAAAVKRALGIASPSKVMIGAMDNVGDGVVVGLDNQSGKVSAAATRFSDSISVSPEVAAYAARQGQSPTVSGNDAKFVWTGDIVTPTEDPEAVVNEVLNEITGRL